jgi:hypothetical protein
MAVVVLAIWLVGAAVTKYSLEQMAYYTPIAMVVLGATAAIVLLWVKVVLVRFAAVAVADLVRSRA